MEPHHTVTQLLIRLRDGEREALDALFPLIYDELHEIAHRQLASGRIHQTLNTTALVHEAYLKLVNQDEAQWNDRKHFLAVAARAMRHILVDYARLRKTAKRGGGVPHTLLDEPMLAVEARAAEIVALDQAMTRLSQFNERLTQVVELRFFGGLSVEEVAQVMDVSDRTVKREWRKARAFLYRVLYEPGVA